MRMILIFMPLEWVNQAPSNGRLLTVIITHQRPHRQPAIRPDNRRDLTWLAATKASIRELIVVDLLDEHHVIV